MEATPQTGSLQQQSLVQYSTHGQLLAVTLNRPKALNALNSQMICSLTSHLPLIEQHQVLWLQGAGGKSFCSGGDVKSIFSKESTDEDRLDFFQKELTLDYRMSQLKALQIAVWDGYVMGGGLGISAFSPIIIATEKTLLAMPQSKLGFFADVGVTYLLSRMRSNIGYYLGMTGSHLKGEEAVIAGLAHFYIESSKLPSVLSELCQQLQKRVDNVKEVVTAVLGKYRTLPERLILDHEHEINQLFSLKSARDIYLQAAVRSTELYRKLASTMRELCPLSLELTFRLIAQAKVMTLKQCFVRDFQVIEQMVGSPDFREGVRCVLLEKGQTPKWTVPDLKSLGEQQVERFLKPSGSKSLCLD